MMVYCRDRSKHLPRKRKHSFVPKPSTVINSYRANDHKDKPSVFERRCASGVWVSKQRDEDEQEAARILAEML